MISARFTAFVLPLCLIGCGGHPSTDRVVDKHYVPVKYRTEAVCTRYRNGVCSHTASTIFPVAAQYIVKVDYGNGGTGWVTVDPDIYDRVHVGGPWSGR